MLDDFLEGDDASIEDLNKDTLNDFVEEENDQEVIKEVQSKSVEVLSCKV